VIVTRSLSVRAAPEAVWAVVADPAVLPRWWPRTERVEGVSREAWTVVLRAGRGRPVRADWRLDGEEAGRRRAWAQQLDGTPFAKVLAERRVEARLAPDGSGTRVTLELRQRGRRWARLGGFLLRRAARRELDGALAGLAAIARHEPAEPPP
jgi:carbon monoxide dehydrogenase subunit G